MRQRVSVLVLGDAGHSPRMLLHTRSFLLRHQQQHSKDEDGAALEIDFIGDMRNGSRLPVDLASNPSITWHHIPCRIRLPMEDWLPGGLRLLLKAIYQSIYLLYLLLIVIPEPDLLLLQTPPAIPTLLCARFVCDWWLRSTQLVFDWHNLAYTLMDCTSDSSIEGSSEKPRRLLVRLAEWLERKTGNMADLHLCVTQSMADFLTQRWKVKGDVCVLYDRPLPSFHRLTIDEMHQYLSTIDWWPDTILEKYGLIGSSNTGPRTILTENRNDVIFLRKDRPWLLVSSTSWTPDENMSILIDVFTEYDKFLTIKRKVDPSIRSLVVVITGKGPMKQEFEEQIARVKLQNIIVLTAWLLIEDYPKLLGCADLGICMHTSSSKLDLPMKVVDMYGCGLPVCAVDYQCITELVEPNQSGLLFRNSKQLVAHLKLLLFDHVDKLEEMRQNIIDRFESPESRWQYQWDQLGLCVS